MIFLEYLGAELSTSLLVFVSLQSWRNINLWYVGPLGHKTDKCNSSADAERIKTDDFGFTITKRGICVQNKKKTSYSMHLA